MRQQTWATIRLLRANPPGLARTGDRRRVFGSALRQAEELFRSAEVLSPSTRPINIFYGLSQAARALAAAGIEHRRDWQLRGHGVTHEGGFERALHSIQFKENEDPRGAYTLIADLVGSSRSESAVPLVDALATLPIAPAGKSWEPKPRPLALQNIPLGMGGVHLVLSSNLYARTCGWPDPPDEIRGNRDALRTWAKGHLVEFYPTLVGGTPFPDNHPRMEKSEGFNVVTLEFATKEPTGADWMRAEVLKSKGVQMEQTWYALPALPGFQTPQHPLMTWWGALWCFSMFARYSPERWERLIDVDQSEDAVGVETVLEDALDVVPMLLLRELKLTNRPANKGL